MRSVNECFDNVKEDYFKFLNKEKILGKSKAEKIKSLKKIYIPISFWIENKYKKKGETLILGFSGGQGSGKTTVTGILKIILKKFFKRRIHVSSIDDFYKTLKDRNRMSHITHPLFKIRGVPGTHDITYTSDIDQVSLIHQAKSRKGFALGAVMAAEWLKDKKGTFTMSDIINFT